MKPVSIPHLPSCLGEPGRAWSHPKCQSESCTSDPKPQTQPSQGNSSPCPQPLSQHPLAPSYPGHGPVGTGSVRGHGRGDRDGVPELGEMARKMSLHWEGWQGRCPCTGRGDRDSVPALGGEQCSCHPSQGCTGRARSSRGMGCISWRSEQILTWWGGELLWENAAGLARAGRKEIPPAEPPSRGLRRGNFRDSEITLPSPGRHC